MSNNTVSSEKQGANVLLSSHSEGHPGAAALLSVTELLKLIDYVSREDFLPESQEETSGYRAWLRLLDLISSGR